MGDVQMDRSEFFESYEPVVAPKLKKRTYIDYLYLQELSDSDFDVDTSTMINLITAIPYNEGVGKGGREKMEGSQLQGDRPYFILFVDQSPESQKYLQMWLKMAETVKNEYCVMAYVNLTFQKKLDRNFKTLSRKSMSSHPFYWARYQATPYALVYRDGWPQGFYNGGFFFQDMLNFIVTVVSDPSAEVDKFQKIRPSYLTSLRKKEMELMADLESEREQEKQATERQKLREFDPREQAIAHAVGFD